MRLGVAFAAGLLCRPASADGAPPATATAANCQSICQRGMSGKLDSPVDQQLYFACFVADFCNACTGLHCLAPPIAGTRPPPVETPLDMLQRMMRGDV